MTNEWNEYKAYIGQPTYAVSNGKDTTFLGRFTTDMIKEYKGFARIFTILARGYLFHNADGTITEQTVTTTTEIREQVVILGKFLLGQILAEEQRSLILGRKVPLFLAYRTADLAHTVGREIDKQSVKLVGIVGIFLVTHKQDAVNTFFLCLGVREVLTCADTLQTAFIRSDKCLDTFKNVGIKLFLPSQLGSKGEKLDALAGLRFAFGVFFLSICA